MEEIVPEILKGMFKISPEDLKKMHESFNGMFPKFDETFSSQGFDDRLKPEDLDSYNANNNIDGFELPGSE